MMMLVIKFHVLPRICHCPMEPPSNLSTRPSYPAWETLVSLVVSCYRSYRVREKNKRRVHEPSKFLPSLTPAS